MLAAELQIACDLARTAGRAVMDHYAAGVEVNYKGPHATQPVTVADTQANALIVDALRARFPQDAILAEESTDSAARLGQRRLWCVDPLDGTRDFIERTGFFAVMIGLAINGRAALGVVYEPVSGRLLWGCGDEARCEDEHGARRLQVSDVDDPTQATLAVSRAHRSQSVERIAKTMGITRVLPMGSVGLKVAQIALGLADLYISTSDRTQEWDACAPDAIIHAAGGMMTDTRGAPLVYNKPHPNTPHGLIASNRVLHPAAVEAARPPL